LAVVYSRSYSTTSPAHHVPKPRIDEIANGKPLSIEKIVKPFSLQYQILIASPPHFEPTTTGQQKYVPDLDLQSEISRKRNEKDGGGKVRRMSKEAGRQKSGLRRTSWTRSKRSRYRSRRI